MELDMVMRKYARISVPFDKTWKRKATEYCGERLESIRLFLALGVDAITDPTRRKLVTAYLEASKTAGIPQDEINFNAWLLHECIGDRVMSDDHIFMRCMGCFRIRTSAGIGRGPCKCGAGKMNGYVGTLETQRILGALAIGN